MAAEPKIKNDGSSQPAFSSKHPLETKWTLWFENPKTRQKMSKYGHHLRSVHTFDSVEDFWCLFDNIRTPGQLQPTATIYLFRHGIEPKWEDPRNIDGGCWTASVNKGPNSKGQLDAWWLNGAQACIGELFTDGVEEVCGIAVHIRPKGDRIELWTKSASNEAAQTIIGRQLKQHLDLPDSTKIGYSVFSEKLSTGRNAKDCYLV